MRAIIAVYKLNWVDAEPLFRFLSLFDVTIKDQDLFGDRRRQIKNTHLIVNGNQAEWTDVDGAKDFAKDELTMTIHYEALIHNIKKGCKIVGNKLAALEDFNKDLNLLLTKHQAQLVAEYGGDGEVISIDAKLPEGWVCYEGSGSHLAVEAIKSPRYIES